MIFKPDQLMNFHFMLIMNSYLLIIVVWIHLFRHLTWLFLSIDETWWKAEFDGKTGVVPSNYVELIVWLFYCNRTIYSQWLFIAVFILYCLLIFILLSKLVLFFFCKLGCFLFSSNVHFYTDELCLYFCIWLIILISLLNQVIIHSVFDFEKEKT